MCFICRDQSLLPCFFTSIRHEWVAFTKRVLFYFIVRDNPLKVIVVMNLEVRVPLQVIIYFSRFFYGIMLSIIVLFMFKSFTTSYIYVIMRYPERISFFLKTATVIPYFFFSRLSMCFI